MAGEPEASLDDWGQSVATISDSQRRVSLGGKRAGAVLIWITDLGERDVEGYRVTIAEVRISS